MEMLIPLCKGMLCLHHAILKEIWEQLLRRWSSQEMFSNIIIHVACSLLSLTTRTNWTDVFFAQNCWSCWSFTVFSKQKEIGGKVRPRPDYKHFLYFLVTLSSYFVQLPRLYRCHNLVPSTSPISINKSATLQSLSRPIVSALHCIAIH